MEDIVTYQGRKDFVYDCMNAQKPGINSMSYGSHFAIDYSMLQSGWGPVCEDYELMEAFITCGLFE